MREIISRLRSPVVEAKTVKRTLNIFQLKPSRIYYNYNYNKFGTNQTNVCKEVRQIYSVGLQCLSPGFESGFPHSPLNKPRGEIFRAEKISVLQNLLFR
jgi:hypothetical protein